MARRSLRRRSPTDVALEADRTYAKDRREWRRWLEANHESAAAVWLVYWKKGSGQPSINWSEAVDEALCFGWIDSKVTPLGADRYEQWFTRRKVGSIWSRINKAKVERLTADGLMAPAGLAVIERARADGSWTKLDAVEALEVPNDLMNALAAVGDVAVQRWAQWRPSLRKVMLYRISEAVRAETRAKRIAEVVESAATGELAAPYRRLAGS